MMKKRVWMIVSLIFSLSTIAHAEMMGEFSAEMVTTAQGQTIEAKIYASKNKMRMEMPGATMITRLDQNVAWMLMPNEGMYMEHPIDPAMVTRASKELPGEVERVSMGSESVERKNAEKFKVTYTAAGKSETIYQWIADDSQMPIKMEAVDGSWSVVYRNLEKGPQPQELFEIPSGYQKFAMPSFGN